MGRVFTKREQQPLLPPKSKTLTAAAKVAEAGEGYGPAKLRRTVLAQMKIYCTIHNLEMQDYLSELVEQDLLARGFVMPVIDTPERGDEPV